MLFLFQLQIKKIKRFKTPKCPTKFKTNEINILLMKYLAHCKDYCLVLHIITEDNAKALQFVKFEASIAWHGFKCYQGEKFVDNF